jgi:hypothetical protein
MIGRLINTLAKSYTGRLFLVPVVILCGAWSWFDYLDGTRNTQDRSRLRDAWGWRSDAMLPEWLRLSDPTHPDYGSAYHSLKNIGSEHARTDVQRAFKMYSFLLVCSILLGASVTVALAVIL